jgi:plasmid maintenance system antidote protein VapI
MKSKKLPKQTEIAMKIGRTQAYVSMILAGQRKPSLDIALKLEKLYGIPPKSWRSTGNRPTFTGN